MEIEDKSITKDNEIQAEHDFKDREYPLDYTNKNTSNISASVESQNTEKEDKGHMPTSDSIKTTSYNAETKMEDMPDSLEDTDIKTGNNATVHTNEPYSQCMSEIHTKKDASSLNQLSPARSKDKNGEDDLVDGKFVESSETIHKPFYHQTHYISTSTQSAPLYEEGDNSYDFSHSKRGYAVIIVNEHFKEQGKRGGADVDLMKMRFIARNLGFDILNKGNECNLDKLSTLQLLTRARQLDHSDCDSFVLMISTHGFEQSNPRAGGRLDHALVCADEEYIFTRDILEMFSDQKCLSLRDKPKIFFIQACRGRRLDPGCNVNVAHIPESSGPAVVTLASTDRYAVSEKSEASSQDQMLADNDKTRLHAHDHQIINDDPPHEEDALRTSGCGSTQSAHVQYATSREIADLYSTGTPVIRCHEDMLVMYAIPDGMTAWRHPECGSWMIDDLYRVISGYNLERPRSFLSLLTKVAARMSKRESCTPKQGETHMKKAVPVIEHKLLKDVMFEQKC